VAAEVSPTTVQPDGVAFWDADDGLLVATLTTPACTDGTSVCPGGLVERTRNGERTWQVVDRTNRPLDAVGATGGGVAWVTSGRCGPASPDACGSSRLLVTSDGGSTWATVGSQALVTSVAPVSATAAWAVAGASGMAFPIGTVLVRTTDGGRTWRRAGDPCRHVAGLALWDVGFAGPSHGWATCVSEPATDMQAKALFSTPDAGATWHLQSDCLFPVSPHRPADVGSLSCAGYLPGLQLLVDGYGWTWSDRYGLAATGDGGHRWAQIAEGVVADDANSVVSASVVGEGTGFVLISKAMSPPGCSPRDCGPQLLFTADAGIRWTEVHSWMSP
jgi:photosystem II stability/assembly factor-like uncharacterized protein